MHRYYSVTVLVILTLTCSLTTLSQRHRQPDERQAGKIEKFKTMRLIEVLKLNEDEAARFTAKQRVHDDSMKALMKDRNTKIDAIDEILRTKAGTGDIDRQTQSVLSVDQKIYDERLRYYGELQKLFTPEQFAKFIIFERNFNRRLRDAMDEMRTKLLEHPSE